MNSIAPNQSNRNPLEFMFEDTPLRVFWDANGEPLFVASDVCKGIEVSNISQALARLDDDEKGDIILNDVTGRLQQTTAVTEPGMYNLILGARKQTPRVKKFKRWITHDVIPSIRKTGAYSLEAPSAIVPTEFDIIRRMIDQAEQHAQQIAALQWQQNALQTNQLQLDSRVGRLEKRPVKGYSSVAAYLFEHKRNESPERITLLEDYALRLSSELGYEVLKSEGDVIVFHVDVLKRLG